MYTFYPEVEIKKNGVFVNIVSPWFIDNISNITGNFFKSRVFNYPIFNFQPRENFSERVSQFNITTEIFSEIGIFNSDNIKKLSYCETKNAYDPMAVYTAIQYERLKYNSLKDRNSSFISKLLSLSEKNENELFALIKKILIQSYYITKHCTISLEPASNGNTEVNDFIKEYIDEEEGHHELVEMSLKELDDNLNFQNLDYENEVVETMRTLKRVAEKSTIALACALGFFESASFQPSDPIADILLNSSKPKAAFGIKTHFDINKKGNHCLVGYKLAEIIDSYISQEELMFTISEMERIETLSSNLIYNIFKD